MNPFTQSRNPKNLVANIVGKKIYLENMSDQIIDDIKRMGAFPKAYGSDFIWLIQCEDEDELISTLQELNRLEFLFVGGASGYPAADVFALLLEKKKLGEKFKEISWRGSGDWFIIER